MQSKFKKGVTALNRSYLAKDFDAFKLDLLEHASIYYPNKIRDFSEASVGGLFLDMAALVGDSMSYYMDHQFREMDPFQAVESANIEMHLRNAGVKVYSAAPATCTVKITLKVPAEINNQEYRPRADSLPVILQNTEFTSDTGIPFHLLQELDFSELTVDGNLKADYKVDTFDSNGNPIIFEVSRNALVISGYEINESFNISNIHIPFRELELLNSNVSEILSVTDSEGNEYYEVESLSQDTVFIETDNVTNDRDYVSKNLEVIPAVRRYISYTSPRSRKTTIRFGSGNTSTLDDDVIPDPSELTLPLYGKKTLSKFSIDPNLLINSQTLGLSPKNTVINVRYRYGGGSQHNVPINSIINIPTLEIEFRRNPITSNAFYVRKNIQVTNIDSAKGGSNAPTFDELRALIPSAKNAQNRIVSRQDLLSRIYTMPPRFGRVYRASISNNPNNPFSTLIYLISLDSSENLMLSPDSLKLNLSTYLNEFRLISDSFDIMDARIINYQVNYEIYVDKKFNKQQVILNVNRLIAQILNKKYFHIDQPLIVDNIVNVIINTSGVVSLSDLKITNKYGLIGSRNYSSFNMNFESNTKKGIIRGPIGSLFEMKFPDFDIVGSAV